MVTWFYKYDQSRNRQALINPTMPPKRTEKWNDPHKDQFRALIIQRKINPQDSNPKYIEKIREKYWPERKEATFKTNSKNSVSEYKIGVALNEANKARHARASVETVSSS